MFFALAQPLSHFPLFRSTPLFLSRYRIYSYALNRDMGHVPSEPAEVWLQSFLFFVRQRKASMPDQFSYRLILSIALKHCGCLWSQWLTPSWDNGKEIFAILFNLHLWMQVRCWDTKNYFSPVVGCVERNMNVFCLISKVSCINKTQTLCFLLI